jgi:PilZ domain
MDSRRQERTRLIYHLRVFDARRKKLIGQLVDITPDGLALIGETAVPVGRTFSLRMDLPRNLMPEGHLTFSAESKWCTKDTSEDFYSMGMRIVKMTPEALALVRKLTHDFYREELEPGDDEAAALGQFDLDMGDMTRRR